MNVPGTENSIASSILSSNEHVHARSSEETFEEVAQKAEEILSPCMVPNDYYVKDVLVAVEECKSLAKVHLQPEEASRINWVHLWSQHQAIKKHGHRILRNPPTFLQSLRSMAKS